MKKLLILLLIIAVLASICGCVEEEPEIQVPVNFYYRRTQVTFEDSNGVIAPEVREAQGHENDLSYLLDLYLSGPNGEDMERTFPYGTKLVSISVSEERTTVTVTSHFANLNNVDLTIACACITKTVMELTNTGSVEIKAHGTMLNGADSVIMDNENVLLLDDSAMDPAMN